ncbi:MAG: 4Fe-4S binding protein [Clostridia bacterium]
MLKVHVYEDKCKSCGLCIAACPKKIIVRKGCINQLGYHPVEISDHEKCTRCAMCATACPDLVLEVKEE